MESEPEKGAPDYKLAQWGIRKPSEAELRQNLRLLLIAQPILGALLLRITTPR